MTPAVADWIWIAAIGAPLWLGALVFAAALTKANSIFERRRAALGEGPAFSVPDSCEGGLLPEGQSYDPSVLADALVSAHRRSGDRRLLSVLYPDHPLERRATVVSLADRGRPYDWMTDRDGAA